MSGAVLTDQQVEIRDLVIGPHTSYCWDGELPNWWGYSQVRTSDIPRMSTDGSRGGRDLLGTKTMTGKVIAQATTQAGLLALIDAFMLNLNVSANDDIAIRANLLGATRLRYGRPRRAEPDTPMMTKLVCKYASAIAFQIDFEDDLNIYSDTLHSAIAGLGVAGGFLVPFTAPFTLSAGVSNVASALNLGTVNAPWTGRIDGPITNPSITNTTTGEVLSFSVNGGMTLAAGEFVLLDSQDESVLLGGTTDRRSTLDLGSQWFDLYPGVNGIKLEADAGSGSFTISWRDAYR